MDYKVTFSISEGILDNEMKENLNRISKALGWSEEKIVNVAFEFGCKWYLKDQLNFIAKTQLPQKDMIENKDINTIEESFELEQ
jgi:hypothetical protein